jgi:hypothetical protein
MMGVWFVRLKRLQKGLFSNELFDHYTTVNKK